MNRGRRTGPRVALLALLVGAAVAGAAAPALAVPLPTEPPSELPSEVPTELPTGPAPSDPPDEPTPEPTPSPTPTAPPTTGPTGPGSTPTPGPTETPTSVGPVVVPPFTPPDLGTVPGLPDPLAPELAPEDQPLNVLNQQFLRITSPDQLVGALGAFMGLLLATVLGGAATGVTTFTMTNRGSLTVRDLQGEIDMDRTRRTRNVLGVTLLAVAGLIGIIGYLRISVETLVPVQVVYLASAGFGVVVFGIAGGSLLVAETLRADEHRVRELESAVALLAGQLAGSVQDPPRLLDRAGPGAAVDVVEEDVDATADGHDHPPPADVPGSREDDDPGTRVVRRIVRRSPPPDA